MCARTLSRSAAVPPRSGMSPKSTRVTSLADPASARDATLRLIGADWRAANFLSVGQIYLRANPLVREPLTLLHVKPRLLGHWGTTPGLNFIYAHMNRIICGQDINALGKL